jgi:hypothetical protein
LREFFLGAITNEVSQISFYKNFDACNLRDLIF